MEYDYDRAERQKSELIGSVESVLGAHDTVSGITPTERRQVAAEIVDYFTAISPPEKERVVMQLITMSHGGRGGGESTKAGNVQLNMKKLCIALSKGAFATVAVINTPWLVIFAALILWDEFRACTKASLSEEMASVLYAMWMHKDDNARIAMSEVETKVNHERAKRNQPALSTAQVRTSTKTLEALGCIEKSEKSPLHWWLREYVSFSYR